MRKKAVLAAVLLAFLLIGSLPSLILGRVGRYPVMSPQQVSYRPSIRCEGQVCPSEGYQLLSSGLYLVEERYRSLGDPVEKGEVIAVLAPAAGEAVLCFQTQGSGLAQGSGADLQALLESYGGTDIQPEGSFFEALWPAEEEGREGERVTVISPVAGVVTQEVPLPGSVVKPGDVIAAVEGREGFFALLTVGEKDAGKIAVGNPVALSGEGIGTGVCQGRVAKIYPGTRKELSGAVTRNVVDIEVSIQLDDREGLEIRPGFSVKAQIFTDDEHQILVIPYESIRQDAANTEYVMVAGTYRLEKRPVTTGQETADGVEIVEGLSPEELVAVLPENSGKEIQGLFLLEYSERG